MKNDWYCCFYTYIYFILNYPCLEVYFILYFLRYLNVYAYIAHPLVQDLYFFYVAPSHLALHVSTSYSTFSFYVFLQTFLSTYVYFDKMPKSCLNIWTLTYIFFLFSILFWPIFVKIFLFYLDNNKNYSLVCSFRFTKS